MSPNYRHSVLLFAVLLGCTPEGSCEAPTRLPPGFSFSFDSDVIDWAGECVVDEATVNDSQLTLQLDCGGTSATLTLPGEAVPSGLQGSSVDLSFSLPDEVNFSELTFIEVSDAQGLFALAVEHTSGDYFERGGLGIEMYTPCESVHEAGGVTEAAGVARIKADGVFDIPVGQTAEVSVGSQHWVVAPTEATALECCHGDVFSLTIVRR